MRVTKDVLVKRVKELGEVLGVPLGLDYVAEYGGGRIEGVGARDLFGYERHKSEELFLMINFALRAIQIDRKGVDYAGYWPKKKEAA